MVDIAWEVGGQKWTFLDPVTGKEAHVAIQGLLDDQVG